MTKKFFISLIAAAAALSVAPAFAAPNGSYDKRSNSNYDQRSVSRDIVIPTRYRARIIVSHDRIQKRRGSTLVCTVYAQGKQARKVKNRHLRQVAKNNCARKARVRIA